MSDTEKETEVAQPEPQTPENGFDSPSKPDEAIQPKPQPAMPVFAEGGTKAWLVVLGCWCTSFASFGIVNSFG